jgi:DNA-directed RNA polymerase subunit RPC12/RpoP
MQRSFRLAMITISKEEIISAITECDKNNWENEYPFEELLLSKRGMCCPRCGEKRFYFLKNGWFKCVRDGKKYSAKKGTTIERLKITYSVFFSIALAIIEDNFKPLDIQAEFRYNLKTCYRIYTLVRANIKDGEFVIVK